MWVYKNNLTSKIILIYEVWKYEPIIYNEAKIKNSALNCNASGRNRKIN